MTVLPHLLPLAALAFMVACAPGTPAGSLAETVPRPDVGRSEVSLPPEPVDTSGVPEPVDTSGVPQPDVADVPERDEVDASSEVPGTTDPGDHIDAGASDVERTDRHDAGVTEDVDLSEVTPTPDAGAEPDLNETTPEPDGGVTPEPKGQWYKAQFHAHTPYSFDYKHPEGETVTLAEVVEAHKAKGYQIVGFSDHGVIADEAAMFDTDTFITIRNVEVTNDHAHFNAINVAEVPMLTKGFAGGLQGVLDAGGMPIINHPGWSSPGVVTPQDVLTFPPTKTPLLMDVIVPWVKLPSESSWVTIWDGILSAGRQVYGLGMDDSHKLSHIDYAFNYVRLKTLDKASVLKALQAGDFYASNGAFISDITWSEQTLTVEVESGTLIEFYGANYTLLHAVDGSTGSYTLTDDDLFVRAEVHDSKGKFALTQAFFYESP